MGEELGKIKALAAHLAAWDRRIVEIVAMPNAGAGESKIDLICRFDPEPLSDTAGFFWIANLLTRMEFEALDERLGIVQPFDLGFESGQQVYLPDGTIIRSPGEHTVVWQNHEE